MNNYAVFGNFSAAVDIGVKVIDKEGATLYESAEYFEIKESLSGLNHIFKFTDEGNISFVYGGHLAYKFGNSYIFFCPRGLVHIAAPLLEKNEMKSFVIVGPMLMTDHYEYIDIDVHKREPLDKKQKNFLYSQIRHIPFISPEKVRAISELLYVNAAYFSGKDKEYLSSARESHSFQSYISDYVSQIKTESSAVFYPLDKEDALLKAMSLGDRPQAKALLNEILGHLFFSTGADFDVFRYRIIELIVLLSRAAVKGGADTELIFGLNYSYLKEIDTLKTIEDLTFWLNKIMYRFTDYVFNFVYVKHVDIIYKAMNYVKQNYMKKLTLEDVAKNVYLSAAYLSKIFKEETKQNFNSYLNVVRIEESKKLLRDRKVNLTDVSGLVGYEDQSYFSKVFKKIEGVSPGKYRQMTLPEDNL